MAGGDALRSVGGVHSVSAQGVVMSRKVAVLAAVAAALSTAVVVLVSAKADPPGPQGERVLRFVERQGHDHFIDNPPRGRMGVGDQALVTKRWFDAHGSRVGTLHLVCSQLTAGRNPDFYCSGIAQLKDGTLTFANGFHLNDELHLASVTGGTGAYAGARGSLEGRTAPGGDENVNDDVVHLLP
jgi:hypothetical protein